MSNSTVRPDAEPPSERARRVARRVVVTRGQDSGHSITYGGHSGGTEGQACEAQRIITVVVECGGHSGGTARGAKSRSQGIRDQ